MKDYHTEVSNAAVPVYAFFKKTFVNVDISGVQVIPGQFDNKPLIICSTHRSQADYFLVGAVLNRLKIRNLRFAAGDNLMQLPFIGPKFRAYGAFTVERDSAIKKSYVRSLCDTVVAMLQNNDTILVFPEGGRSYSGAMLEIKGGIIAAGVLAQELDPLKKVQFLPMSISWECLPELLYFNLLGKGKSLRKPGNGFLKRTLGALYYYGADLIAFGKLLSAHYFGIRYGSIYIDFGAPFAIDEIVDIAARRLPNARDDFAAHRVSIAAICKAVHAKFKALYAVLPEHVLAAALHDRGELGPDAAAPVCAEIVQKLKDNGRNMRCLAQLDINKLVETAVGQLRRQKAVTMKNGKITVRKNWVVEYYAAAVES